MFSSIDRYFIYRRREQKLLTKGDNNPVDDIDLYNGLSWLERKHIVGVVRGSVSSLSCILYLRPPFLLAPNP